MNSCRCRRTLLPSSCGLFLFSSAQKSFQRPERKGLNLSACLCSLLSLPLQPTLLTSVLPSFSSSSSDSAAQRFRVNKFSRHFAGQTACGVLGLSFFSFLYGALSPLFGISECTSAGLWRLWRPAVELELKHLLPLRSSCGTEVQLMQVHIVLKLNTPHSMHNSHSVF